VPMSPTVEDEENTECCDSWAISEKDFSQRSNGDIGELPQQGTQEHDPEWDQAFRTVDETTAEDEAWSVPIPLSPLETDDDGMELVAFCAGKQLTLQACTIFKCAAPAPSNNQASRPSPCHPEQRLAKANQGSCNDSISSEAESLFHL